MAKKPKHLRFFSWPASRMSPVINSSWLLPLILQNFALHAIVVFNTTFQSFNFNASLFLYLNITQKTPVAEIETSVSKAPLYTTGELWDFEWSVLSRTNSCNSRKVQDLATGFRAQPGVWKFRIKRCLES